MERQEIWPGINNGKIVLKTKNYFFVPAFYRDSGTEGSPFYVNLFRQKKNKNFSLAFDARYMQIFLVKKLFNKNDKITFASHFATKTKM